MITSKYTIREQNEAIILKTLIDEKEISRAALSELTGLNKASVSAIAKKLMGDHLITETRIGDASNLGGRKPIMLTYNGQAALALAVDIAPQYVEGMLTYSDGTILDTAEIRNIEITEENALEAILTVIKKLTGATEATPHGIIGLAVAIHGLVDEENIIFTPNYSLPNDLKVQLENQLDFPVFLENEANLAALGEYTFSSSSSSLVSLSIHTGIGAGIVENGILRTGQHRKAGEIGHSILFPNGKPCPCGNNGCFEQYASHQAIYKQIEEQLAIDTLDSAAVIEKYLAKEPTVIALLKENAHYLSIAISSLAAVYDPELVIINSSIYRELPELLELLKGHMTGRFSKDIQIANSSLNRKATLFGGISMAIQNFLNIQNLKIAR